MLQNTCVILSFVLSVFSNIEAGASISSNSLNDQKPSIELDEDRGSTMIHLNPELLASVPDSRLKSDEDVEFARVEFWGHVRCQTHVTCPNGEIIQCSAIAYGQVICDHRAESWVRCNANSYSGHRDVRYFGC